jgi:hypothetical protein
VRLAAVYRAAGLQPPDLAELPADLARRSDLPLLLRFLERDGTLMRLSATRWISGPRRLGWSDVNQIATDVGRST